MLSYKKSIFMVTRTNLEKCFNYTLIHHNLYFSFFYLF